MWNGFCYEPQQDHKAIPYKQDRSGKKTENQFHEAPSFFGNVIDVVIKKDIWNVFP